MCLTTLNFYARGPTDTTVFVTRQTKVRQALIDGVKMCRRAGG